jgi:ribonuclease P protein component
MPSYRFPQEARIRKRRDFLRIQNRGHRLWGRQFIVYVRPSPTKRSRLGITVSRKVGGAVQRNRIKRWVREAFRTQPELFSQPIDIVLIAKRGIDDFSLQTIREDLARVVSRYYSQPNQRADRSRHRRHQSAGSTPRPGSADPPSDV